jgi:hypothetical protein
MYSWLRGCTEFRAISELCPKLSEMTAILISAEVDEVYQFVPVRPRLSASGQGG